jgi:hypothetical protein
MVLLSGTEKSAEGEIHANHRNVRSVFRNVTKMFLKQTIQIKIPGMLTYGIVLFQDSPRPHAITTARTLALLDHINWELFDQTSYIPDFTPSVCHQFFYTKTKLCSQILAEIRI